MTVSARRLVTPVATLAIIVAILAVAGVGKPPVTRSLMIHSDDAGMCDAVNSATIDGLEKGSITSTSIMVCCPGFETFARYAADHPEHDNGVHLTLTSEMPGFRWGPVLGKDKVPTLVREDGTFWRSEKEVAKHVKIDDVERELRAQIERARSFGINVSHLDHHMWVLYSRPDLLELYVRLGAEFQLPIRFGKSLPPEDLMPRTPELIATYEKCRGLIESRGMPVFDLIDSENYDVESDDKRAYFLDRIRNLRAGTSEFVVHCSYDPPGSMKPHAADRRSADTRVFTSAEIVAECRRLGIELVNYRQLLEKKMTSTGRKE